MIEENNEPIIISMYVYLLDINFIKRLPIDSSTLFISTLFHLAVKCFHVPIGMFTQKIPIKSSSIFLL